jgi:hypothetical protein
MGLSCAGEGRAVSPEKALIMDHQTTLEAFIEESIRHWREHHVDNALFMRMREAYGTVGAIKALLHTPGTESELAEFAVSGLYDWSLEAAVIKFPAEFSPADVERARRRIDQIPKTG